MKTPRDFFARHLSTWSGKTILLGAPDTRVAVRCAIGLCAAFAGASLLWAAFTNGGFETGTPGSAPPSPWVVTGYLNPYPNGITPQTPQTLAGLNLLTSSPDNGPGNLKIPMAKTVIVAGSAPFSQTDPTLGLGASLRFPRYGKQAAVVNQLGNLTNVNMLSQTMVLGAADVDPADGQMHIRFAFAPVMEEASHPFSQEPYYFIQLTNASQGNAVVYSSFGNSGVAGIPWKSITFGVFPNQHTYAYTDWQLVDIAGAGLNAGDTVNLQIIAAGCSPGGHFGEVYVDGVGPIVPGLSVEGTGPSQANPGTNIAYTLKVRNDMPVQTCTTSADLIPNTLACVGGVGAETGVQVSFTTPPDTTYQSIVPPPGATCATPSVGATGTITCTFTSPVGPGANASMSVTVAISPAAPTSTLVEGNYSISSTQETPLVGPAIDTQIGCLADNQCATSQWCNEFQNVCTPKLPNGAPIPTDGPHVNPVLNGTCTLSAAALVCQSGVCDPASNACGYVVGEGPCNASNGAIVCRSGACSVNQTCEPAGGCNVTGDCSTGHVCSAGACVSGCVIGGNSYLASTVNPDDACQVCAPASSPTNWSNEPDGFSCAVGQVCSAGSCASDCFIGGSLYTAGLGNPNNACQLCTPASSTTAWSNRLNGTVCDDSNICTQNDNCQAGVCAGTPIPMCQAACVAFLTVTATPPPSVSLNLGDTATFTAAATGSPTITVQWQISTDGGATWLPLPGAGYTVNNTAIAGGISTTLSFVVTAATNGVHYKAVFSNPCNTVAVDPVVLIVDSSGAYQVRYFSNLDIGESNINIINTGFNGAPLLGPGFAAANIGNICVNAYVLSPDEQLISCCSCLVTPNQIVNLGVKRDFLAAGKTLTGAAEQSLTVKLVGSNVGASSCANSAAQISDQNFAGGFVAFGTTLHATTTVGSYATTETPFLPAQFLTTGAAAANDELHSLAGRCASILANGSGYGICNTCQTGALSAQRK